MPNLYLFMHGLFAVAPRGNSVEVALPDVPGHVQRAGTFLAETNIARRSVLQLRGVDPGNASLPSNGIVDLSDTTLTSRRRAVTLWLPQPQDVLYLRCAADPNYVVKRRDSKLTFNQNRIATVVVLIYQYPDENQVFLEGHYWEPRPSRGSISLHIISTSETLETQEHEDETQDVMAEVLRGYPGLDFKKSPRPLASPWIDPGDPAYGLTSVGLSPGITCVPNRQHLTYDGQYAFLLAELEYPAARAIRLARLGEMIESQWTIATMWRVPDALSDQMSNCMTVKTW